MKEEKIPLEVDYLNKMYRCAQMGVIGVENVLDKAHDGDFKEIINTQKREYDKLKEEIELILAKYGFEESELGKIVEKSSEVMSEMKLKMDDSDSQIAKMMMEGNNKGIIEITKIQNHYEGQDEELKNICHRFLKTLEHNLQEMKKFL